MKIALKCKPIYKFSSFRNLNKFITFKIKQKCIKHLKNRIISYLPNIFNLAKIIGKWIASSSNECENHHKIRLMRDQVVMGLYRNSKEALLAISLLGYEQISAQTPST